MKWKYIGFIFFALHQVVAVAQLRLPSLLSSNMVLQQNDSVLLWGQGNPAEKVFVTTSWNAHTDSAITGNGAQWKLKVKTPAAGGPYSILFRHGTDNIVLTNVMIGEVWVCSGQSNMDWNYYVGVDSFQKELNLNRQNNIRFFYVAKSTAAYPQEYTRGEWTVCDSNRLKSFSAIAYFFGKKLQASLHVPVGLIQASWGGTPAETWTPAEAVCSDTLLQKSYQKLDSFAWWPKTPGAAYNAMIYPLVQYKIAGAIWYQGEGNTANPDTYGDLFTTMIRSWRNAWKKNFPFYYVQIAPYTYGAGYAGSIVREQQAKASAYENVGMIVIPDLVSDTTNIHPQNKRDVGFRLANYALAQTYQQQGVAYRHPQYASLNINGSKAYIRFSYAGGSLIARGAANAALEIAGADRMFYPAQAKIEKDVLVVWSSFVKYPVAVRYAFSNAGIGNLFSKEGLPVIPFRTDDWPLY